MKRGDRVVGNSGLQVRLQIARLVRCAQCAPSFSRLGGRGGMESAGPPSVSPCHCAEGDSEDEQQAFE